MATIRVNSQDIEIDDEQRLNGIQAAELAGIDIPHYCWHDGLSVVASCRMCLVETGTVNAESGEVQMMPKLVPACQTLVKDGTVIITDSEKVVEARAMVEEDLLINHPIDCPICDKAGECRLQDYHFLHGQKERRADIRPFTSRKRELGDTVQLFVDRCVMCTRCVRFTREITGTSELMVSNRGASEEIDIFPNYPLANKMSGNVVDLCPVGALADRDFLYNQRVWFMKSHDHVCAGCSTGCSIHIDENQDQVYRLRPRDNPAINQWWMCDEGRYGYAHLHAENRLTLMRKWDRKKSQYVNTQLSEVVEELSTKLKNAGRVAMLISPQLTVEEAYLLAKYARSLDSDALLAIGPVPVLGEDESFPNGFTIRAEKCPNRRGVEEVIDHFAGEVKPYDDFLNAVEGGDYQTVWVTAGYKADWIDEEAAAKFEDVPLLIVQDMFDSPLWQRATYQLPSVGFAERSGSFVNVNDRLQAFEWAIRPPAGARAEGHLCWQLLGYEGLYSAKRILQELAKEIIYFNAALGEVNNQGVNLKVNQVV